MKVRYYVDILTGASYQQTIIYSHASASPARLTAGWRRFYFDVDFPPGTFAEEHAERVPVTRAEELE